MALLATAHKNLRHEFARLTELYDKDRAKFYTWKHGYPRFLMHALWLGVGEDDTMVPIPPATIIVTIINPTYMNFAGLYLVTSTIILPSQENGAMVGTVTLG